jgi:hypothetical protein
MVSASACCFLMMFGRGGVGWGKFANRAFYFIGTIRVWHPSEDSSASISFTHKPI